MDLFHWLQHSIRSFVLRQPGGAAQLKNQEWQTIEHAEAGPPPAQRPPLAVRTQRLLDGFRRMAQLRNNVMLAQAKTANEIQSQRYKARHEHKSIMDMLAQYINFEGNVHRDASALKTLREQLTSDEAAFYVQTDKALQALSDQKEEQWRLAQAEANFMQTLADFVTSLPDGQTMWSQMQKPTPNRASSPSDRSSEVPTIAQDYFSRAGELGFLRERMLEAERSHSDERVARNRLIDQDEEPPTTEAEFESQHEEEISALKKQIDETFEKAELLRRECKARDIDLNALRHRNSNETYTRAPRPLYPPFIFDAFGRSLDFGMPGSGNLAIATVLSDDPDVEGDQARNQQVREWLSSSEQ